MTAEAREQEGLVTMASSNIHILCQHLQMVRVCETDQFSWLLVVSDSTELQSIDTNLSIVGRQKWNADCQFNALEQKLGYKTTCPLGTICTVQGRGLV